jgi:hypothetical protein
LSGIELGTKRPSEFFLPKQSQALTFSRGFTSKTSPVPTYSSE